METLIQIKARLGTQADNELILVKRMENDMKILSILTLTAALGLSSATGAWASGDHAGGHDDGDDHGPRVTRLLMPIMSSSRGMDLFVDKGCVACHAVNGVGGHDASPLDAHNMDEFMNPFDLAAKMWMMAPYMIEAQEEALGGQILFTGEELADIIAFLHDDVQQHEFTEHDLTNEAIEMMEHGHGVVTAVEEHMEEIGHSDDEDDHDDEEEHDEDEEEHDDG